MNAETSFLFPSSSKGQAAQTHRLLTVSTDWADGHTSRVSIDIFIMHFKVIALQHGPMFESLFILFSLLFRKSSEIDRIKQNHAGLVDCVSSRKRCAETS